MATRKAGLRTITPDLAALRQAKGISLSQIAEATKIRTYYLEAIEKSRFEKLPGGVFTTSYIRQYARAIDYDESDLLAAYESTLPQEETEDTRVSRGFFAFLLSPVLRLMAPR